jgi:hypothetical protein
MRCSDKRPAAPDADAKLGAKTEPTARKTADEKEVVG